MELDTPRINKLTDFVLTLVDQGRAARIVEPKRPAPGHWFGGGNLTQGPDGRLYLVGRFRNAGDSRTGVGAGERGLELAVLVSSDQGSSFQKVLQLDKLTLSSEGRQVLSIEGSALNWRPDGVELLVSTEREGIGYPSGWEGYLKPGTGVWSIQRINAPWLDGLLQSPVKTILQSLDLRYIHLKDPFVYCHALGELLLFCSHPYCWTSSNTGYARRRKGEEHMDEPVYEFFPRGVSWDVAMSRGTCMLDVPRSGQFREVQATLLFYDGGECVRNHEEHRSAVNRPRGYSCEELGGAAVALSGDFHRWQRLSVHQPLFVSPHGTGCSRYVDVLEAAEGFYATWQQAQPDGSQPLVMNFLPREEAEKILA